MQTLNASVSSAPLSLTPRSLVSPPGGCGGHWLTKIPRNHPILCSHSYLLRYFLRLPHGGLCVWRISWRSYGSEALGTSSHRL